MNHFRKHKRLWTIIVFVASLALIVTSVAPFLLYTQ